MTSRPTLALAALLSAAFLPAPTYAQHHGSPGPGGPGHPSHGNPGLIGRGHAGRGHHGGRSGYSYPYYWGDWDYWDDYGPNTSDEREGPSAPPVNISVQQRQAPAAPSKPADSLLLEYREGQWVRIPTGSQMPVGPQNAALQESAPTAAGVVTKVKAKQSPSDATPSPVKLPPAVLVFKDGHQEEVVKYVVNGNFLYTSADYWSTGSWTRRIPIGDLDVPASVKANADRGAKFTLPSRPSEVVVRF